MNKNHDIRHVSNVTAFESVLFEEPYWKYKFKLSDCKSDQYFKNIFFNVFFFFGNPLDIKNHSAVMGSCASLKFSKKVIAETYQPWALNSKYCTESCSISISERKSEETERTHSIKEEESDQSEASPNQGGLESIKMWIPRCLESGTAQFHPFKNKKTVEQPGQPDSNQQIVIESDG